MIGMFYLINEAQNCLDCTYSMLRQAASVITLLLLSEIVDATNFVCFLYSLQFVATMMDNDAWNSEVEAKSTIYNELISVN